MMFAVIQLVDVLTISLLRYTQYLLQTSQVIADAHGLGLQSGHLILILSLMNEVCEEIGFLKLVYLSDT